MRCFNNMLTLINTNTIQPPIAPVGVDYLAAAVEDAGFDVEVVDLALARQPSSVLRKYFDSRTPELIGLTFRNTDDCFWPSAHWFVPELCRTIACIKELTSAPIVLGGVGFSMMTLPIMKLTGADFGIRGDGEQAICRLLRQLAATKNFERVPGLIWRQNGSLLYNRPAWSSGLAIPHRRGNIDNLTYFRRGGQIGLETKRGCNRKCLYCADALAKGPRPRLRRPTEVADEFEALLAQGIDLLHLCDSEFNIPRRHAVAVCQELIRRRLGRKVRWYAYMAVLPFDAELAHLMQKAGCLGINFTADAACLEILKTYCQKHRSADIKRAVQLCRRYGIAVMIDLLLGGPGETPDTLAETINFMKSLDADCFGAALGLRIYEGTAAAQLIRAQGPLETNPALRRRYAGPVEFCQPTFYISHHLGEQPARLVRDLIGGDDRFFEPSEDIPSSGPAHADPAAPLAASTAARPASARDHNYNQNQQLIDAINAGARGAYWHILRRLRTGEL